MINPGEIPQIPGDMDTLAGYAATLQTTGEGFADTGAGVHTTFQGLAPHYIAPEAGQLFAATQPVSTLSADLGGDIGSIGGALGTYAQTVKPIQQRLTALRGQAESFVQEVSGDDDWREDGGKVEQHNTMLTAVNDAVAEWMEAQRVCANTILALYTDKRYRADDGDGVVEDGEFGYTADQLDQALGSEQGLPWGTPEQEDEGFFGGLWSGVKGFFVDGAWADLTGLGALVGFSGSGWSWQTVQDSWGALAHLTILPYLDDVWRGDMSPWEATTTVWGNWGQVGQSVLAWDEWSQNPARAFGQVLWNVVTIPIAATKALKPVTATGHAADAGRVASAAGDAGRLSRITTNITDTLNRMPTVDDIARTAAQRLNIQIPHFGPVPALAGDIPTSGHRFDVETPGPRGPDTVHMDTSHGPDGPSPGAAEPPRTPDASSGDTTPSTTGDLPDSAPSGHPDGSNPPDGPSAGDSSPPDPLSPDDAQHVAQETVFGSDRRPIGVEDSPGVYMVSRAELEQVRADLHSGLGVPEIKHTPKGPIEVWTLSDDPRVTVTYRPFSRSGGPTIDFNGVADLDVKRLHIKEAGG
ncbi:MAG: hypothetical protein ACRDSL_24095 [Pseudonocardiaceae bacterium]